MILYIYFLSISLVLPLLAGLGATEQTRLWRLLSERGARLDRRWPCLVSGRSYGSGSVEAGEVDRHRAICFHPHSHSALNISVILSPCLPHLKHLVHLEIPSFFFICWDIFLFYNMWLPKDNCIIANMNNIITTRTLDLVRMDQVHQVSATSCILRLPGLFLLIYVHLWISYVSLGIITLWIAGKYDTM